MTEAQFLTLLEKYADGQLPPEDYDRFFQAVQDPAFERVLKSTVLEDLQGKQIFAMPEMPAHIAQDSLRRIHLAAKQAEKSVPRKSKLVSFKLIWRVAAAVLILVLGYWGYLSFWLPQAAAERAFAKLIPAQKTTYANTTSLESRVELPDGSLVWMQPGAKIHVALDQYQKQQREVYLEGEAFFDVQPNPQRPFLVYYRQIVTRVLGTSFRVATNRSTGNVEVAVKTGRVQVFENEALLQQKRTSAGVIVTPNQMAVYAVEERLLSASVVSVPTPLVKAQMPVVAPSEQSEGVLLRFRQTPFSDVLAALEKEYGLEIMTETPALLSCQFTGDLSNTDLFTQLRIICLATGSSYDVMGTRILIKGEGCPDGTDN